MATNKKAPTKTTAPKKTTTKAVTATDAPKIEIPDAVVTVQEQGGKFIVTETSPDGGVYQSYESDTNPLEETE